MEKYKDKDYLYHQYWVLEKSMSEIAKENKVNRATVRYFMIKLGIKIRSRSEVMKGNTYSLGKKRSEETKQKISEAHKGQVGYWKGKKRPDLSKKLTGIKRTEETRKKMSQAQIGKEISLETRLKISKTNKGQKGFWKGKHHTEETKKKMSENRYKAVGSEHFNWKGGLVKVSDKKHLCIKYKRWMKEVKDRDGWKCRIADKNCKGRLEAHHILTWIKHPELRYEVNNGITLCVFHHPRKRSEEERLSPYFSELVKKV